MPKRGRGGPLARRGVQLGNEDCMAAMVRYIPVPDGLHPAVGTYPMMSTGPPGKGTPSRKMNGHLNKGRGHSGWGGPYHQHPSRQGRVTRWSYYHEGDVEVPEICVYSIENRCMHEATGCVRLHAKCTSQWQLMDKGRWYNFRNFHSIEIETAFEDVTKDRVSLSIVNPAMLGKAGQGMLKLMGTFQWEVDFNVMVLKRSDGKRNFKIRRVSTQSAAISKSAKATTFEWYFLDANSKWVKYGQVDTLGRADMVTQITSEEIESKFISGPDTAILFSNSKFQYQLDFTAMTQTNLSTGNVRVVRRRPVKKQSTKHNSKTTGQNSNTNQELPVIWDKMSDDDKMTLVALSETSQEYRDVMTSILSTIPNVRPLSIKRIQSPFLWRPFKNKEKELAIKYGRDKKLNIQKLFHGTKSEHVNNICRENIDWRLHGSNIPQLYGQGTYFSNSAACAHGYSTPDAFGHRFLMVAEVIIGQIAKGDPSMKRPPKNPTTGELYDTTVDNVNSPKVFVKYDKQEYCPFYIIELS
ncbi:protein mono-ADP-ribosyltransferase PARP11-like [Penaeus monodon]|uniref:protein mono-ADP-ribosyltransferase PARP11-like n=1 Tax=Penaeus monodon TaxID=6687 RepID=UPI0018A74BAA|nr:protein mono-ADP-ribosyltransferase PARP11-like [Penaeus monodon]